MKKLFVGLISVFLVVFLSGCIDVDIEIGEKNEISKMYAEGYTCVTDTVDEDYWYGILRNGNSFYKLTASLSSEDKEDYYELLAEHDEMSDREYQEERQDFLFDLKNIVTKEDLKDKIPREFELKKYVGMTVAEFEASGFKNNGIGENGGGNYLIYENSEFVLEVYIDGIIGNYNVLTQNDLNVLKVSDVKFTGFSESFLTKQN